MNPLNVANYLVNSFLGWEPSAVTAQEEDFAMSLKEVIIQCIAHGSTYVEKVHDLFFEGCGVPIDNVDPVEDCDTEYEAEADTLKEYGQCPVSDDYKEKAVSYWLKGRDDGNKENMPADANKTEKKKRKWTSVQTKFKKVTQESLLHRWRKKIISGRSYVSKIKTINQHAYAKFMDAKQNRRQIHDVDLRRWAVQKAREIQCANFKGSRSWCSKFKARNRIVSRKITKFISKKDLNDKEAIENNALDCVLETQPLIEQYGPENVVNADHAGFAYEMHGGRTLEEKGVKKVEILAQRKNALTHSYTILPTMSVSGKLIEPLFVILQEKDGEFGPIVQQTMHKPPNILVAASKSGKMEKRHISQWANGALMPSLEKESVILLDAWSAFSEQNVQSCIPDDRKLHVQHLPPGTTSMIQPRDVYGFRIYKNLTRHISDYVMLHDVDVELAQRDNILKLQSLIYNQLCSPRYTSLFKYSWFKSGYICERPEAFPNPVKFCFVVDHAD